METPPKQTPDQANMPPIVDGPEASGNDEARLGVLKRLGEVAISAAVRLRDAAENITHKSQEAAGHTVNETQLTTVGIRKRIAERRLRKAEAAEPGEREYAGAVYRQAAEDTLSRRDPSRKPAELLNAETFLQERAALRANRRLDSVNKSHHQKDKWTSLYGYVIKDEKGNSVGEERAAEILSDSGLIRQVLSNGHYTRAQEKAMKRAGKNYRKAARGGERALGKLERSAAGEDVPGRLVGASRRRNVERIDRLTEKLDRLSEREDELRDRRRVKEDGETARSPWDDDEPPTEQTKRPRPTRPEDSTSEEPKESESDETDSKTDDDDDKNWAAELLKQGIGLAIDAASEAGKMYGKEVWERYKNGEPVSVADAQQVALELGMNPLAISELLTRIGSKRTENDKARSILEFTATHLATTRHKMRNFGTAPAPEIATAEPLVATATSAEKKIILPGSPDAKISPSSLPKSPNFR